MTEIHVKVSGASAVARRTGPLVAGTVGMPAHFSFDDKWAGLNVIAVFEGAKTLSAALLGQTETTVPWEVLAESGGQLRIGAEGRKSDGSVVITTVWANAGYITEGAVATDEEGNPPTPGIYDQIMAAIAAGQIQGEPGVSPVVQVTDIPNGHRVTITDIFNTQSFDLYNGEDATVTIVDNLDTRDPDAALSANMGNALKGKIETDLLFVQKSLESDIKQRVKTVNGTGPDENGNVVVQQVSDAHINELITAATDGRITSLEDELEALLADLNYKNISITAFSCPGAGTYEMGQSVAAPTITWSLNKEPASQNINGETLGVAVRSKPFSGSLTSNKTYTLTVKGQKGETATQTGTFTFLNGVYYGSMVAGTQIDNAAILALTKKLQSGRSVSFSASNNRPVYACPTRYGTPKFTIGGFEYEWDNVATFNFTNASGYTESYSVWMHTQNVSGSVTINVT